MNPRKIKVIFIGTSDFGLPAMRSLAGSRSFELGAVITQPDKPAGRKMLATSPPVKTEALKHGFPVLQPRKIGSAAAKIAAFTPDIMVVAAYAQILPETILKIPKYGCINIHASLLPKYRGAACVQAAILNGDTETGVTVMKMDAGLDTGPILNQKSIKIVADDTAGTLHDRLALLAAEILEATLKLYIAGEITPSPQDEKNVSFAKELKKQDGKINWPEPAEKIKKLVRAMNPWPGAFCFIGADKKMLKIIRVGKILEIDDKKPGKLFMAGEEGLAVQCGRDSLIIEKLQLPGKRAMTSAEFLNGYRKYADTELK